MNSNRVMDFIENNLNRKLDHTIISEYAEYSKFHFHRLFLESVGCTVMSYVTKRRIIRSRYDLLFNDKPLSDIAAGYGFVSYDTFTRSFKRIYGMPPNNYRKYYDVNKEEKKVEMNKTQEKPWLSELSKCTQEDREYGLKTLYQIVKVSEIAYKEGLLALENIEVPILTDSKLFKLGLELMLDGIEPSQMSSILGNYIVSGGYINRELLVRVMIMEGMLMIQMGSYPWIVRDYLASFLGEEFSENINETFGINVESEEFLMEYLNSIENKYETSKDVMRFEKAISALDARSLQRLLREVDSVTICSAIEKINTNTQNIILSGLPKRKLNYIREVYRKDHNFNLPVTLDAQNSILLIMKELKCEEEINC